MYGIFDFYTIRISIYKNTNELRSSWDAFGSMWYLILYDILAQYDYLEKHDILKNIIYLKYSISLKDILKKIY